MRTESLRYAKWSRSEIRPRIGVRGQARFSRRAGASSVPIQTTACRPLASVGTAQWVRSLIHECGRRLGRTERRRVADCACDRRQRWCACPAALAVVGPLVKASSRILSTRRALYASAREEAAKRCAPFSRTFVSRPKQPGFGNRQPPGCRRRRARAVKKHRYGRSSTSGRTAAACPISPLQPRRGSCPAARQLAKRTRAQQPRRTL